MNTNGITGVQRRFLASKLGSMQRELGRLIEHLYLADVPADDALQLLTSQAFDDLQLLNQHIHDLAVTPQTDHPVADF